MLDAFLKSKFYNKCKSDIKITKTRLETIKKKRNAVQKYMKNDIADLLRSGLDINAYGRADGLLVEQNMSSCYELINNFCGSILNNLSLMEKQRECPEECRDAVPSLMYAAARVADLPELRDLRSLFTEKYGNSLESYINKEFVEKLKPKHATKEMKLQLMHDIAKEFSIEWDSKALEQRLYNTPMQDQTKYRSLRDGDDNLEISYRSNEDAFARRNMECTSSKGSESDLTSHGSDANRLQSSSEDETATDFSQDGTKKSSSSIGSVSEDEVDSKKPFYYRFIPPPYLKPKTQGNEDSLKEPTKKTCQVEKEANLKHGDSVVEDMPKPRSVRRRFFKQPVGRDADDSDEKERIMDGLLMHYSKKRSPYESGKPKANPQQSTKPELAINPPARASSLPPETSSSTVAKYGHNRASSLQPGMQSTAGHVHPKLPEYDDLAARIAALRKT
ncbi:hypothetical protein FNV43_RR06852 [Rhamnella rubrinervis]|uniref:Vacuolar protein sorting-associated protein Ist1 n=1 Tax=Rhamnella rubrinervis TaxID=2594499 RepID=A0A8K0HFE5_9ROSA|nr:hypothetical protein FNV43_RR06852 [Rhamnella rubrinervis]